MNAAAAKGTAQHLANLDAYDFLVIGTEMPQIDFISTRAIDDMLHITWANGHQALLPTVVIRSKYVYKSKHKKQHVK